MDATDLTGSMPPLGVPSGREAALDSWTAIAQSACPVDPELYVEYDVKRGLRDQNGRGVLAGLTRIGDVVGTRREGDQLVPAPGRLLYRGIEPVRSVASIGFLSSHGAAEQVNRAALGVSRSPNRLAESAV